MEKKITKREMFAEIIAMAKASGRDDIKAFAEHEIQLLEKKASHSGGMTANQKQNEAILPTILSALEIVGRPVTLTELQAEVPSMAEFSNQKLSALMKKLVDTHKVIKTSDKRKSLFSLPEADEVESADEE